IDEVRADQNRAERIAYARLEITGLAARLVENQQLVEILVGPRTAKGALGQVGDDRPGAGGFLRGLARLADEYLRAASGLADAVNRERTANLQRMNAVDAILAALQRRNAHALVAFRETAMQERHGHRPLAGLGMKPDVAQPLVNLRDGVVQDLVDPLVILLAADHRAEKLLAVQQRDDG